MSRRRRATDALVANPGDPVQVREAQRADTLAREQQLDDLRAVLALPSGQRVLWRLMEHCKVFGSTWDPSARIHYNAGRQDVGHFLMAEIEAADPGGLWTMHRTVNQQRAQEAAGRRAERLRQQESEHDDDE